MSTLVEELEQDADFYEEFARRNGEPMAEFVSARVARLRKRMEHIKALRADFLAQTQDGSESAAVALLGIERATGDLP